MSLNEQITDKTNNLLLIYLQVLLCFPVQQRWKMDRCVSSKLLVPCNYCFRIQYVVDKMFFLYVIYKSMHNQILGRFLCLPVVYILLEIVPPSHSMCFSFLHWPFDFVYVWFLCMNFGEMFIFLEGWGMDFFRYL